MKSGSSASMSSAGQSAEDFINSRKSTSLGLAAAKPAGSRVNTTTFSTISSPSRASSTMGFNGTGFPRRTPASPTMTTRACASSMRSRKDVWPSPA